MGAIRTAASIAVHAIASAVQVVADVKRAFDD